MLFLKNFVILISLSLFSIVGNSQSDTSNINAVTNTGNITTAPIVLKNDTIYYVSDIDSASAYKEATNISKRLTRLTKDYVPLLDSLTVNSNSDVTEILINDDIAIVVSNEEAKKENMSSLQLAQHRKGIISSVLAKKDADFELKKTLLHLGYFTAALILLIVLIKTINWAFKKLDSRLVLIEKTFLKKNRFIIKYFITKNTANIFVFLSKLLRIGLIVLILFVYAPFMFSFFPWAEKIVEQFYDYILEPIKFVVFGFIDYIPSLIFIVVIFYTARFVVRVVNDISEDLESGKFKIKNFHKDWAKPTGKLLGIFIYAVSLILIFPYLPGSGSSAFQGVSIFIGAIISFGSTSAISNIIAGVVITYMRPFQVGDRVKINDNIVGDIVDKTILVTHIRTLKNEDVTIPNANVLTSNIINYSSTKKKSIILHTTVTLGYDLPWQQAEELLLSAASKVSLVLEKPAPFVLQTSLDDNYVSYELNAYTDESKKMPLIYSEIHKNIQDVFNEAGVEILSPSYIAARDGNLPTVPSKLSPEDRSPIDKIVDHLTGRNQKIIIKKNDNDSK